MGMAMKKIFKFKSWYSIEESAARLSLTLSESVTPEDVIQLAAEGHIKAHWFLNGDYLARPVLLYCNYDLGETRGEILSYPISGEFTEYISGMFLLPVNICTSWGWWLLTFIGKGGQSGSYCGAVVVDEKGNSWELVEIGGSDFMHFPKRNEIAITSIAIEEFEKNASLEDHPNITNENSIGSRERESLLKQIGAIALVLAEKSGKYSKGSGPNVSQIALGAEEVIKALPDANQRGLSQTSLRNSITMGLDLLKK